MPISHLEFLTEPVLRELRDEYERKVAFYAQDPPTRRWNEYRRLLREANAELFIRTRESIAVKHG